MNYIKFLSCCFCLLLFLTGCGNTSSIPDEKNAEQVATSYMLDKYGIEIEIRNTETTRVGFTRYKCVFFNPVGFDSDHGYNVYIAFDESNQRTPTVISDTYMNYYLNSFLTKYLNTLTGAEITKTVNIYSREDVPDGFPADFPIISDMSEVEALISSQKLYFDHWIYIDDSTSTIEQNIRNNLYLFKDDDIHFHIIRCTEEQFASLCKQKKNEGDFELLILLDRSEIIINTLHVDSD